LWPYACSMRPASSWAAAAKTLASPASNCWVQPCSLTASGDPNCVNMVAEDLSRSDRRELERSASTRCWVSNVRQVHHDLLFIACEPFVPTSKWFASNKYCTGHTNSQHQICWQCWVENQHTLMHSNIGSREHFSTSRTPKLVNWAMIWESHLLKTFTRTWSTMCVPNFQFLSKLETLVYQSS
jgi:hypothetical protein